ncbi:response regulator transcription factor [Nocardioides sp. YIM 152588]|uniref:response regulator n=1 Tax=Nocardioides sp. YIM 152588 TaxID=3158259 RepID=UPI0032E3C578
MGERAVVRVLIVDDQEPYRAAMAAVVDATPGFELVGSAVSGEQSLAAAAALGPELVLMDVNLPGIDGVEATRRLLSGAAGAAPVVVLLSTYDEDQVDAAGCGASAYIPKGAFGPDRLAEAWRAAQADGG